MDYEALEFLDTLLQPWYRLPIYAAVLVLGAMSIRIAFKVDVNSLLKDFQGWLGNRRIKRQAKLCRHAWTLYSSSPYSRCNSCLILIQTSTLLAAEEYADVKPMILGIQEGMVITAKGGSVVTNNYVGMRDRAKECK